MKNKNAQDRILRRRPSRLRRLNAAKPLAPAASSWSRCRSQPGRADNSQYRRLGVLSRPMVLSAVEAVLRCSVPLVRRPRRLGYVLFDGLQMTVGAFCLLDAGFKAAADKAGIANAHPRALRHGCGHALAMKGRDTRLIQDYLGHRNIQHTSLYRLLTCIRSPNESEITHHGVSSFALRSASR
jgi:Phage integrase family